MEDNEGGCKIKSEFKGVIFFFYINTYIDLCKPLLIT